MAQRIGLRMVVTLLLGLPLGWSASGVGAVCARPAGAGRRSKPRPPGGPLPLRSMTKRPAQGRGSQGPEQSELRALVQEQQAPMTPAGPALIPNQTPHMAAALPHAIPAGKR